MAGSAQSAGYRHSSGNHPEKEECGLRYDDIGNVNESMAEESKLEQRFNQLAVNLPKNSKHEHGHPVGGQSQNNVACNLGKNIPNLHKVRLGKEQVQEHNRAK